MKRQTNRRRCMEHYIEERHLKLPELREAATQINLYNKYIYKDDIPDYPRPQFQVSFLKHDTTEAGLRGIWQDGGFKNPHRESLVWWSLSVRNEDIAAAERKLMEEEYSGMNGQIDLMKFATSPAFSAKSRLGTFRFIFPLEEVLKAYSHQFCSGGQPIIRVYKTVLYKQEILYGVLVHSPDDQEDFSHYPLLTEDPNAVCSFRDGSFCWRSEAMCETHWYGLFQNDTSLEVQETFNHLYYVWDNVAIAFHVREKVLKFDVDQLRQNLEYCEPDSVMYNFTGKMTAEEAEDLISTLFPPEDLPHHSRDGEGAPPQPPS